MRIEDVMPSTAPEKRIEGQEIPPGMEAANDEEQESYDRVVLAGDKILYGDKTRDNVIKGVMMADDPARGLASVAQQIMVQLDEKSGGQIPETVILPAAAEIMSHLAELVLEAGVEIDEGTMGEATQHLLLGLGDAYGVSPEEIQELLSSVPPEMLEAIVAEQEQFATSAANRKPAWQSAQPADAGMADEEMADEGGEALPAEDVPLDEGEV